MHADEAAALAEIVHPAEADRRFDADTRRGAEHGAAIGFVLLLEQLPAWHRDDRGGDALGRELIARRHRDATSEPVASSVTLRAPSASAST